MDEATKKVLEEAWELLQCAYYAHQKMGLEGQGNRGLPHETRMFAAHFSQPETPKTPEHVILSGDGRYWKWREAVNALHDAHGTYADDRRQDEAHASQLTQNLPVTSSSPSPRIGEEEIARKLIEVDGCGLTIEGERVLCDDPRATQPVSSDCCTCRVAAKAIASLLEDRSR
jgi:hypothetical protein